MIKRETLDKISSLSIVDVVSEYVTLSKAGVNYKGLCPFHSDKNPSFWVSPTKGICHCFVCGKGGGPITFVMEQEHVSFSEACHILAKRRRRSFLPRRFRSSAIRNRCRSYMIAFKSSMSTACIVTRQRLRLHWDMHCIDGTRKLSRPWAWAMRQKVISSCLTLSRRRG